MATKKTVQSVEPNIADLANGWLKSYKLDYKLVNFALIALIVFLLYKELLTARQILYF